METEEITSQNERVSTDLGDDNANIPRTYVMYDPEANLDDNDITNEVNDVSYNSEVVASIHDSARLCDFESILQLVHSGVFVDAKDANGLTPLQILCGNSILELTDSCTRCVGLLLDNGANISVLDSDLNSLLHLCVRSGNEPVLELLLKRNDVMIDGNLLNKDGETALQLSAKVGQLKCLQCLVLNTRPYVPPTPTAAPAAVAVTAPASAPSPIAAAPDSLPSSPIMVIPSPRTLHSPAAAAAAVTAAGTGMPSRPKPNLKALVVNAEAPLTADHMAFNEISPFPHLSGATPPLSAKAATAAAGVFSSSGRGAATAAAGSFVSFPSSPDHSLTMSVDLLSRSESCDEVAAAATAVSAAASATAAGSVDASSSSVLPSSGEPVVLLSTVDKSSSVNSILSSGSGSGSGSAAVIAVSGREGGEGSVSGSEKTALSREQKRLKLLASLKEKEKKSAAAGGVSAGAAAWMQYEHVRDQGLLEDAQANTLEGGAVEFIRQQYTSENQSSLARQIRSNVATSVFSSGAAASASTNAAQKVPSELEEEQEGQHQQQSLFSDLMAAVPSDWVECYTASGDVYYYNQKTEVVQWENPHDQQQQSQADATLLTGDATTAAVDPEAAATVSYSDENPPIPQLDDSFDQEADPRLSQSLLDTSLQYSTNTEYYPEDQYGYYQQSEDTDVEGAAAATSASVGAADFGAYYESAYYGTEAVEDGTEPHYPSEAMATDPSAAVEGTETSAAAAPASDWVECYTEQGDLYYYNTVTEQSQWENPYDQYAPAETSTTAEETVARVGSGSYYPDSSEGEAGGGLGAEDFFASGVAVTDYNYYNEYGTASPAATAAATYSASQVFESSASPGVVTDSALSTTPPLPATKVRRGMATRTISVDPSNQTSTTATAASAAATSPSPVLVESPTNAVVTTTAGASGGSHSIHLQNPSALQLSHSSSFGLLPSPMGGGYGLDSPALRDYYDSREKALSPMYGSANATGAAATAGAYSPTPAAGAGGNGINNSSSAFSPHLRGGVAGSAGAAATAAAVSIDKRGLLRQRVGSSHSVGSVVSMSSLSDQSVGDVDADDAASGIAGLVSPDDSRIRRRVPLIEPEADTLSVDDSNNQSAGDDNTSTASNNTERHLEIWSRFFENAFSAGNKREAAQKQQRRKAEKSKRQSSARAIVGKSGAVLDGAVKPPAGAGTTAASSSNKWPSPLSDKRYRALITLAVSRSGSGSNNEDNEAGEDGVDTTGIDLSILSVALLAAVTQNDLTTVEDLLQSGANPNCVDDQVRSPAHHAAKSGNTELLALLYDQGADLEMVDQVGRTPLHIAAVFGREGVAEFLLACAVDVEGPPDHSGNTPLHLAARGGHVGIVRLLLQFGASVKGNNSGGMTALEIAQTMHPQTSELVAVAAALQGRVSPRESDMRRHNSSGRDIRGTTTSAGSTAAADKLSKMQSIMKGDKDKNKDQQQLPPSNPADDRTSRRMDLLKQQARDKLQIKDSGIQPTSISGAASAASFTGSAPGRPVVPAALRSSRHVVNPNISDDSDEEVSSSNRRGYPAGPAATSGVGMPSAATAVSQQSINRPVGATPPQQQQQQQQQQLRPVLPNVNVPPVPSAAAPPPASSAGNSQSRRYEKFAEDSASDPEESEDEGGTRGNGSNLIATSVWGVATTLIDMSLSMFSTGNAASSSAAAAAAPTKVRRTSSGSSSGTANKTTPPSAAGAVKSSGLSWFSRKPSVEDENQAAIERLIGGGGPRAAAPPTDSELFHKGLGFHATPPPDIVAKELAARMANSAGNGSGSGGGGVSNSSTPPLPPSEVQVAVAMARAESLRHSPSPYDTTLHLSSSGLSTTSLDDASSVGSPTGTTGLAGNVAPIGSPPNNGYSIGASLPKGVSWRYVDVLNQQK